MQFDLAPCPRRLQKSGRGELLKLAFLHRAARRRAKNYDLCISTCNELDFGIRGVQYIHCPIFGPRALLNRYDVVPRKSIVDRSRFVEQLYRAMIRVISGGSDEGFRLNQTLVNSRFIGGLVKEAYQIESVVVYPIFAPVREVKINVPWEEREFRFVSVGRFAPEKKVLELVDLYASLARRFGDAKFSIVGRGGDEAYYQAVKKRAAERRIDIELRRDASDDEIRTLLGGSKIYLHAKPYEHFGISVLEAVQAGCMTFVHDSGGQAEIVRPRQLRYRTSEGLGAQIAELMVDGELRRKVLEELRSGLGRLDLGYFRGCLDKFVGPMLGLNST